MTLSIRQTIMRCLTNKARRGLNSTTSTTNKSWRSSRKRRKSFRKKRRKDKRNLIRYGESRKSNKPKSKPNSNSKIKSWPSRGGMILTKNSKRSMSYEKSRNKWDSSATVNTWGWSKRRKLNLRYIARLRMTIARGIMMSKDSKGNDISPKGNQLSNTFTTWSWSNMGNFTRR
jgi:hypothetical protein